MYQIVVSHGLICSNKQTQRYLNAICLSEIIVFSHLSLELLVQAPRIDKVIIRSSYCSIFKEQASSTRSLSFKLSRGDLIIISHLFAFVKSFLWKILIFSQFRSQTALFLEEQIYYTLFSCICQVLFQKNFIFSQISLYFRTISVECVL